MKKGSAPFGTVEDALVVSRFLSANALRIDEARLIARRPIYDRRTKRAAKRLAGIFEDAQMTLSNAAAPALPS